MPFFFNTNPLFTSIRIKTCLGICKIFFSQRMNDGSVPWKVRKYFWTPCQKWQHGRKPFKLALQIIKIIAITIQIYNFGKVSQGLNTQRANVTFKIRQCGIQKRYAKKCLENHQPKWWHSIGRHTIQQYNNDEIGILQTNLLFSKRGPYSKEGFLADFEQKK